VGSNAWLCSAAKPDRTRFPSARTSFDSAPEKRANVSRPCSSRICSKPPDEKPAKEDASVTTFQRASGVAEESNAARTMGFAGRRSSSGDMGMKPRPSFRISPKKFMSFLAT
jgi:hypothetical protein